MRTKERTRVPKFDLVSKNEAVMKTASGKAGEAIREYLGYIAKLSDSGQAGRLQVMPSESARAVRRRLGTAAKLAGRSLVIKRAGDEIYFWVKTRGRRATGLRRGRPRKNA
jgi:hypothetical protein